MRQATPGLASAARPQFPPDRAGRRRRHAERSAAIPHPDTFGPDWLRSWRSWHLQFDELHGTELKAVCDVVEAARATSASPRDRHGFAGHRRLPSRLLDFLTA